MNDFVDCNELADFLEVDGIDLFDNPGARCLFFLKKLCNGSIGITFIEHENVFSISYEINGNNLFSAKINDVLAVNHHNGEIEIVSRSMNKFVLSKIGKNFLLIFNA